MQLNDPQLYRQQAYIDGKWTDAGIQDVLTVQNPATGENLGHGPQFGQDRDRGRNRGG